MNNISAGLAIYHENYLNMERLVKRLTADLDKYSYKDDANEGYIERQNEYIQQIAGYVNIADFVINEVLDSYTPPEVVEEKENKIIKKMLLILKKGGLDSIFDQIKFLKTI